MIHQLYTERFRRLEWELRDGPVGPFVDEFASLLLARGYARKYLRRRFAVIAELNRWLIRTAVDLAQLDNRTIDQFIQQRSSTNHTSMSAEGELVTLRMFIALARSNGAVPADESEEKSVSRFDEILSTYKEYSFEQKGIASTTLSRQLYHVRRFLWHVFGRRLTDFSAITADDIMTFIRTYARGRSGSDACMMVGSIRSFLRFLVSRGEIRAGLAECVPAVPSERHKRVPSHLSADELKRLLKDCKGTHPVNRRNHAVLLLLARLGLRASEVVRLSLDDIDWGHGELTIQGKGNRQTPLPLPKDVGNALVAYLKYARPRCSSRRVFISTRAPYRPMKNGTVVSTIVSRAVKRAGLNPRKKGAHLLRHTLATECLRKGATLGEVGQILRHESIDTTAIYTKVDFVRLRTLAMPWPIASSDGGVR